MAEIQEFDLAKFVFDGEDITVEDFKIKIGQDKTEYPSCDSRSPYAVGFENMTIEWEANNVKTSFKDFFKKILEKQEGLKEPKELPVLATYSYNDNTGDMREDTVLYGVSIGELSSEVMKPFSVSGAALSMKRK